MPWYNTIFYLRIYIYTYEINTWMYKLPWETCAFTVFLRIFLFQCSVYDVCMYMSMCGRRQICWDHDVYVWRSEDSSVLVLVFCIVWDRVSLLFVAMYAGQLPLSFQGLTWVCSPSYLRVRGLQMHTANIGFTWGPKHTSLCSCGEHPTHEVIFLALVIQIHWFQAMQMWNL